MEAQRCLFSVCSGSQLFCTTHGFVSGCLVTLHPSGNFDVGKVGSSQSGGLPAGGSYCFAWGLGCPVREPLETRRNMRMLSVGEINDLMAPVIRILESW